MNTKEKILASTLRLYNQRGVANVSARDICSDLDISPGNFSYHYPSMRRLVTDLYSRLVRETAAILDINNNQQLNFRFFLELKRQVFEVQYRYRFFYLNLFDILQKFDDIKELYLMQYEEEKIMIKGFIHNLKALGYLKYGIQDCDYEHLINIGQVLNNTWLIDSELHSYNSLEEKLINYLHVCSSQFIPFLTEKGKKEYHLYLEELKQF